MADSPAPAVDPAILLMAWSLLKFRYFIIAVYCIQVWEWLINFSDEHLFVHKARWTSVKVAFLYCRYFPLFIWPYVIWGWVGDHPREGCSTTAAAIAMLLPFFAIPPVVVFIIRAYAFTGRHKFILAILMSGWIALFVAYIYRQVHDYSNAKIIDFQTFFGTDSSCIAIMRNADNVAHKYAFRPLVIYSICQLVFDSLVAALVIIHSLRFRTFWGPLGKSFIFQTMTAYIVLVGVHLCFMLTMNSEDMKWDGAFAFSDVVPNVIACRLILMLRRQVNPSATQEDRLHSQIVKDAFGRLPPTFITSTDDDVSDDHEQVIESWD